MIVLDRLILRWDNQNGHAMPPLPLGDVIAFFNSLDIEISDDVILFYSKMNGMLEMENDAYLRIWAMDEILTRNLEISKYGLLFADHFVDSWFYRLKPVSKNHASIYIDYFDADRLPKKVFDSLEEFLNSYEKNPTSILGS